MKFGLFDHIDRRNEAPGKTYAGRLQLVAAAEKAGFYGYHLAEHHWTPLGMAPSPSVFLAAVIQHTQTIRIGSMVHLLPLYHPLRLIEELCMLDHMSGGRLQFGIGRGVSPFEVGYFGVNATESYDRHAETLDIVLKGLTQDSLTHKGRYYQMFGVPMELKPLQKPYPPLWAGAGAPDSLDFCARHGCHVVALGPNAAVRMAAERYKQAWPKFDNERKALGSTVEAPFVGHAVNLFVAESDAEADKIAAPAFAAFQDSLAHLWLKWRSRPAFIVADLAAARKLSTTIIGSPATVRAQLEQRFAETGTNYAMLEMAWGTLGHEAEMRSMKLFADEVMPHFADA
jgi:alkanesulfonate monooxygenase SsuD/methylene tetrahydromethanopterin reductase-like flavin-dependent oxidoreductase (luciferase family)